MPKVLDITNKKYGRLTAIEVTSDRRNGKRVWRCRCDCGTEHFVAASDLCSGNSTSCGCYRSEITQQRFKKNNYPARFNKLYDSYKRNALHRDRKFDLTEEEFYDLVRQNCYYCGAVPSHTIKGTYKEIFLYNGIDRIDNTQDYISGNCIPCCWKCNKLKSTLGQQDFLDHIFRISTHLRRDQS